MDIEREREVCTYLCVYILNVIHIYIYMGNVIYPPAFSVCCLETLN